jgi:uncharacterized cupin superfamily protein
MTRRLRSNTSRSAQEATDVIEYPDSGKVLAIHHMTSAGDAVDYWDGEH